MRSSLTILHGVAVALASLPVHAEPSRAPVADARPMAEPAEVLEGKLQLLAEHLDDLIAGLQAGNLKQFAAAYVQLARTYRGVGDEMQTAFRASGAAAARIELSRQILQGLTDPGDAPSLGGERWAQLAAGVVTLREELLQELRNLRQSLEGAGQSNQVQAIHNQMHLAVERIEQLDRFLAARDDASKPTFDPAELDEPLAALEAELDREGRLLEVQAAVTADLMDSVSRHVDKALQYLELETGFPYAELESLQRTRRGLDGVFADLQQMRQATSAVVTEAVERRPGDASRVNTQEVLQRAGALLDRK